MIQSLKTLKHASKLKFIFCDLISFCLFASNLEKKTFSKEN